MNNDISRNTNNYINKTTIQPNTYKPAQNQTQTPETTQNLTDSSACLNAMGCAQVNMSKPERTDLKKALNFMKKNPELVEMHLDFTDFLVKNNYSLEDAIRKTDDVFTILQNKKTWKEN